MFEVGFTEILLISVLALVVLGPEKLPRVAAQLGRWMGRARTMARQFREQLEDEVQLAETSKPKPSTASSTDSSGTQSTATSTEASGSGPNVIYPEHSTPSPGAPAEATDAPPPEVTAANNAAAETAHSDYNGPAPEPEAAVYEPPAYAHAGANGNSSLGANDGAPSTAHTSTVESPPHSDDSPRKTGDFITTTHERGI
jgi:sec-independent protein translocase protein TatB